MTINLDDSLIENLFYLLLVVGFFFGNGFTRGCSFTIVIMIALIQMGYIK